MVSQVELAVTLPARALRHLHAHSDVHLNVELRDQNNSDWVKSILLLGEASVPIRDLPFLRAQAVWFDALNLGNGSKETDLPVRILASQHA